MWGLNADFQQITDVLWYIFYLLNFLTVGVWVGVFLLFRMVRALHAPRKNLFYDYNHDGD